MSRRAEGRRLAEPWTWALLAAGALHTTAFAPLGWWPVQFLCIGLLAASVADASPARAAWRGACFSLGWLVSGLWWLYVSMHDYGNLPAPLAAGGVLLLSAVLSLYLALAMAAWARGRRGHALADPLAFGAWWLLAELARAQWFTGFPWMASGYVHTDGPLAALAPWIGVYGIGAVAAWLSAGAVQWLRGRSWRAGGGAMAAALLLPLAAGLAPDEFTEPAGTLHLSLLQTNVAQDVKFDPEHIADNMRALREQLHAARAELVLTPESVLPIPRDELPEGYWADLTAPFRQGPRAALVGTFLGDETRGYVNSMVGVNPGVAEDYAYGKRHLLPFGEFVPWGFRWFVDLMQIPLGDQASGRNAQPFEVAGQRVRPLICYEDLFGEDFAAAVVGPQPATVLVNASNLAWFGRHMIQAQHLQFSRMRTLEFQRPLARATNTGATAAVDHRGRVLAQLPPWEQATLDVTVEGRTGSTPYARWLAWLGLWPAWGLAAAAALWARRQRPAPERAQS